MRFLRSRPFLISAGIVAVVVTAWLLLSSPAPADSSVVIRPTRGEFVVPITVSGELRALSSVQITAPANAQQAGAYQMRIQSLVPEGTEGARLAHDQATAALRLALSVPVLAVQMPLWTWGARGEGVRAAEADRARTATLSEATLEPLAHDAHFAVLQLAQARRNVALYAIADSVAGRRFEVAYNRYTISRITIDNLFVAQQEKDQAVGQYAEGLRRYWQAHYRLRQLTLFDYTTGQPIH